MNRCSLLAGGGRQSHFRSGAWLSTNVAAPKLVRAIDTRVVVNTRQGPQPLARRPYDHAARSRASAPRSTSRPVLIGAGGQMTVPDSDMAPTYRVACSDVRRALVPMSRAGELGFIPDDFTKMFTREVTASGGRQGYRSSPRHHVLRSLRVPLSVRDALIAIATLLAPDAPDVASRTADAHTDPGAFLRAHADRLDERGVDEPLPELAWIALVDALTDHGLLAEVDWKEAAEDIIGQLRELRSSPQDWTWAADCDTDLPTYDFLQLAGARLRDAGTALAVLDIESDCYPLVLLPAARADELVTLATTAGFTAGVFPEPQD